MTDFVTRRDVIQWTTAALAGDILAPAARAADHAPEYRVAAFTADVTPRLGHPLLGGHLAPARSIDDPLLAKGLVLIGAAHPIVLVSVDWCEIRNDAYDRWREVLAKAAGTVPERVLVTSVHQHDAPIADLTAQRLLAEAGVDGRIIDPDYHERTIEHVAAELKQGLQQSRRVTHYGLGKAKVDRVASNRRVVMPDGKPAFPRGSGTNTLAIGELPEGQIGPWLRVISFWDGAQPIAAINAYATRPIAHCQTAAIGDISVALPKKPTFAANTPAAPKRSGRVFARKRHAESENSTTPATS